MLPVLQKTLKHGEVLQILRNNPGKRVTFFPHFKSAHAMNDHHCFMIKLNFNSGTCIMFALYFLSAAAVSSSV